MTIALKLKGNGRLFGLLVSQPTDTDSVVQHAYPDTEPLNSDTFQELYPMLHNMMESIFRH